MTVSAATACIGGGGGGGGAGHWHNGSGANPGVGGAGGSGAGGGVVVEICKDSEPPSVTGVSKLTAWANTFTATISATDADSGVYQYAVTETNVEPTAGWQDSPDFPITENGTYYAWAEDNAGFVSPSMAFTVDKLDTAAPTVTGVAVPDEWGKTALVTIDATDTQSGVSQYACTSGSAAPASGWQSVAQFTLTLNGDYYAWAKDAAGNVSASKKLTVNKVDAQAPTITGVTVPDEWGKTALIAIDATDDNSGVSEYACTSGNTVPASGWQGAAQFALTQNNIYFAWARDKAGNVSASKEFEVTKVDTSLPAIVDVVFSERADRVTVTASDTGSNVKSISVNGTAHVGNPITAEISEGVYSLALQAEDNAGNLSPIRTEPVPDVVPPTIDGCVFADGGISAVITASDKGSSGLKGIYINGEFSAGGMVSYTLPRGVFNLSLQAEDNAGNKSPIKMETVPDNIAPVIESVEFSKDGRVATVGLSDTGGSGIKGASINGEFFPGDAITYNIPTDTKYLTIYAEDRLGNRSASVKKRVPGWTEIITTLTINPVEFSENNTRAKITAATSQADTTIVGIFVNDVLYTGNPVTYKVPEGVTVMKLQAVNNLGDRSVLYTLDVPPWNGGVRISSVNFTPKNDAATIKAVDDTGIGVKGIYVNSEFFEGSTVVYTILNGTTHLQIQAINLNGDTSEIMIKRVPGWSEVVDTLVVKSVEFSKSGLATITAESTGAAVSGIYVNEKFLEGNPVLYTVPASTKSIKVQAENIEGDKSPIVYKEVAAQDNAPIVDTLAIKTISFAGSIATIEAESSGAEVSGIYINDKLFSGNPVLFPVTSSVKTIKAQAVNTAEERSPIVYKEIPTGGSSSAGSSSKESGKGKAKITITAPGWTAAAKAKVKISASDNDGIVSIEASTDYGDEEDVTDQNYIYVTKDTTVTVKVTNDSGNVTKKSLDVECFDREAPAVTVTRDGNDLTIRATDKKSGVAAFRINNKTYKTNGLLDYTIPDGVTSVSVQAEDQAGNLSDPMPYKADKPVIAVPVAGTITTVVPTPTEPTPEEPTEESIADEEVTAVEEEVGFINLLPDVDLTPEENNNAKIGALVGLVLAGGAIVGLILWRKRKKKQDEFVDEGEIDLDYDLDEDEAELLEEEKDEENNVEEVNFKVS